MDEQKTTGTLYIVATPIGNSRDMSERGREILSTADIIAAEDTRRSVVLLNKLGIRGNSLSANHKFNEYGIHQVFHDEIKPSFLILPGSSFPHPKRNILKWYVFCTQMLLWDLPFPSPGSHILL